MTLDNEPPLYILSKLPKWSTTVVFFLPQTPYSMITILQEDIVKIFTFELSNRVMLLKKTIFKLVRVIR